MKDQRYAYGATCSWSGPIAEVGTGPVAMKVSGDRPVALPCCPICGGVLFEIETEAAWWDAVAAFEKDGPCPNYSEFHRWVREESKAGRCQPVGQPLVDAFTAATGLVVEFPS